MYKGKRVIALIPARGGSKGLPDKNILLLAGKPLIAWTIMAALNAPEIDRVIVSTDSEQIADVAREWGAEVPFSRPSELSTDDAKGIDVVFHALDWLAGQGESVGLLILLQPTSPLRTADDIHKGFQVFQRGEDVRAVVSVARPSHHPLWANTLPDNGWMGEFIRPDVLNRNRQDLPAYYELNGAIYIAEPDYLRQKDSFISDSTFALIMEPDHSVDIDSKMDLVVAEQLIGIVLNKF